MQWCQGYLTVDSQKKNTKGISLMLISMPYFAAGDTFEKGDVVFAISVSGQAVEILDRVAIARQYEHGKLV